MLQPTRNFEEMYADRDEVEAALAWASDRHESRKEQDFESWYRFAQRHYEQRVVQDKTIVSKCAKELAKVHYEAAQKFHAKPDFVIVGEKLDTFNKKAKTRRRYLASLLEEEKLRDAILLKLTRLNDVLSKPLTWTDIQALKKEIYEVEEEAKGCLERVQKLHQEVKEN